MSVNNRIRSNAKTYENKFKSVNDLKISKSDRKNKRLKAEFIQSGKSNTIHFGDPNAITFADDTSLKEKRKSYIARASNIRNKEGRKTHIIAGTPNSLAFNILWQ